VMSEQKLLAIDPGAKGGLAWTDGLETSCCNMPETLGDIVEKLRELSAAGIRVAYLEQVVGFIPMASPAAMFSFGQNFGQVQGALAALNFRVIEVRPAKWQKELSLGNKSDWCDKKQWKTHLKNTSQKLYPLLKINLSTADALLILRYAELQQ
jgi:hypothetical protein